MHQILLDLTDSESGESCLSLMTVPEVTPEAILKVYNEYYTSEYFGEVLPATVEAWVTTGGSTCAIILREGDDLLISGFVHTKFLEAGRTFHRFN